MRADLLCPVGGRLLEGPAWVVRSGALRFVDILAGELLTLDLETGQLGRISIGRACSAWIGRRDGGSIVATRDGLLFLDEAGAEERSLLIEADMPTNRANDAKCDPLGRLWIGTMSEQEDASSGSLYRVEQGAVARVLDGVTASNGLGWSPDGLHMYYVDSPTRRVDVFDYDLATGTPRHRRCLVDTSDLAGFPDGLAVDAAGCLWIAFWDGGALHRFSPSGEQVGSITLEAARPTSCAFFGARLNLLAITTAATPDGTGGDVYFCGPRVSGLAVADYDA